MRWSRGRTRRMGNGAGRGTDRGNDREYGWNMERAGQKMRGTGNLYDGDHGVALAENSPSYTEFLRHGRILKASRHFNEP